MSRREGIRTGMRRDGTSYRYPLLQTNNEEEHTFKQGHAIDGLEVKKLEYPIDVGSVLDSSQGLTPEVNHLVTKLYDKITQLQNENQALRTKFKDTEDEGTDDDDFYGEELTMEDIEDMSQEKRMLFAGYVSSKTGKQDYELSDTDLEYWYPYFKKDIADIKNMEMSVDE